MGSYPVNAEGAGDPRNEEREEEYQSQNQPEGGPEAIGVRIVAIPSQAGAVSVIPRSVDDQPADVAPLDPMRMVDVQRQQRDMAKSGDLVKPPANAPPLLQQASAAQNNSGSANATPAGNANRAGSGATAVQSTANAPGGPAAAKRPGNQAAGAKPAASAVAGGPPKPGTSGTARRAVQGNGSQGKGATTGAKQQNSSGQNVQGHGGWIEKGKDLVGQVEKGAKNAEDSVVSWFHRLMAGKDGDAKKTGGAASGPGGQGVAQPEELPTIIDGNHGKQNHEVSKRKPTATVASSEGGSNIYKPSKGQKIEDVVNEGYMPDDKHRAECVHLVKGLVGAPSTSQWKQGQPVTRGANISPGTAIATFVKGSYPQGPLTRPRDHKGPYSDRHAAIYLGQTKEGIWVMDQDNKGKAIHTTLIPWDRPGKGDGNNGSSFSVIEWPRKK